MNKLKLSTIILASVITATNVLCTAPGVSNAKASSQNNSATAAKQDRTALKKKMNQVPNAEFPGILAQVMENGKTSWKYAAGIADLKTGKKMQADYRFRIGSLSKTFIATVIMQLAGEKKLSLEDTVEKWLPGVVQGNGYDGNKVTIRQLLNHTSGLADTDDTLTGDIIQKINKTYAPEDIIKLGLSNKPEFDPGSGWQYSNTNYVLLGMLVPKVTGKTYAEEIKQRIIKPLNLKDTFSPGTSKKIPGEHARGYNILPESTKRTDVTEVSVTAGSAAGDMISSAYDLNRFFSALLGGKLLPAKQLKEMLTTIDTGAGMKYGLGIFETMLPNGVSVWGHSGGTDGFISQTGASLDGKHVMTININVYNLNGSQFPFIDLLQQEFKKKSK